jgi:hypothetical protein
MLRLSVEDAEISVHAVETVTEKNSIYDSNKGSC